MAVLPPRPLLLDQGYLRRLSRRSWGLFAVLLAAGVAASFGSVVLARDCLEERALWARGTPGVVRSISGQVEENSGFGVTLFYGYKLDVQYADAQGAEHRGRSEFDLTWTPLKGDVRAAKVRYDPAQPDHFVLSSPVEAGLPRWGLPIIAALMGALAIFALFEIRRSHSQTMRAFTLCAEDGEETLAALGSLSKIKGAFHTSFQLPGREKAVTAVLDEAPLVVTRNGARHVVVLRSPRDPDRFTVVRESLAPFAFDPETKARLLAQALGQGAQ